MIEICQGDFHLLLHQVIKKVAKEEHNIDDRIHIVNHCLENAKRNFLFFFEKSSFDWFCFLSYSHFIVFLKIYATVSIIEWKELSKDLHEDIGHYNQKRVGQVEQEPDFNRLDARCAWQGGGDWQVDRGEDHHACDVDCDYQIKLLAWTHINCGLSNSSLRWI